MIDYREAKERDARIAELERIINRVAVQVGHPPIAPGEGGLDSIAETVERYVANAREREETLDDVLDWYSIERQEGVSFLTEFQKRYPAYAADLAQFEEFLQKAALQEGPEKKEEE